MLSDRIIQKQCVDTRSPEQTSLAIKEDNLLSEELDPLRYTCSSSYEPHHFPLPSFHWNESEWPHCGYERAEQLRSAYETFQAHNNTQNALALAAISVAAYEWFTAASWYQLAANHGRSSVAMAELSAIFMRGLDTERDTQAGHYWYRRADRILSGLLLQEPNDYAAEIAGKRLMHIELHRYFADPKDLSTFEFFGRPKGGALSIRIDPRDLKGQYTWSRPEYITSVPPGSDRYRSVATADVLFDFDLYQEAERRLRNNSQPKTLSR